MSKELEAYNSAVEAEELAQQLGRCERVFVASIVDRWWRLTDAARKIT